MSYYKKRNKVGNKKYNKAIDIELRKLEESRKPKVKRNGKIIDKSPEETQQIKQLQSLKYTKRNVLKLHKESNRISLNYFNSPCVYRLWDNEVLVYVGQTNNLAYRIGQHIKTKKFTSFDVYSHIENEQIRLNVERRLIEANKPKYNIQHNN